MNELANQVLALVRAKKYDDALRAIAQMEEMGSLCPHMLVIKGDCIELGSGEGPYELADAEAAYREAMELDRRYLEPVLELARFYYAIYDDAPRARPLFEKALEMAREQLNDVVEGYAKCIDELESQAKAIEMVKRVAAEAVDVEVLQEELEEW